MYSKLDLIEQTTATGGKMRAHSVDFGRFYADAWAAFDAWISDVFTQGKTARVPRFAVFGWEILGTGTIGGGAHKPYFLLSLSTDPMETWFPDRARVSTATEDYDPLTVAMKFSRLLNKDLLSDAVGDLLKTFRKVARGGADMSIEFSVGRFVSRGGTTQFFFDSGLYGRVSKAVGFALEGSGGPRPVSSFASTAKPRGTGTPLSFRPPVSPLVSTGATVPRLPLPRSSSFSAGDLSTRRVDADPLKARRIVADAAYQRHMDLIKAQQEREMKAQQQYDMEVMGLDCDILNMIIEERASKKELKKSLDVQRAALLSRRQHELEQELAPPDITSGSILPTMDLRKYEKYKDAPLPGDIDLSRMSIIDAAAFRAQYSEVLADEERRKELKDTLDAQVSLQRESSRRRKEDERALERKLVREVAEKEAEDFRARLEARHVAGQALKASWDRDAEVRLLVAQKQKEMINRANRWRADMTQSLARTFKDTGTVDLKATVKL